MAGRGVQQRQASRRLNPLRGMHAKHGHALLFGAPEARRVAVLSRTQPLAVAAEDRSHGPSSPPQWQPTVCPAEIARLSLDDSRLPE
jgi:hypothetical protein